MSAAAYEQTIRRRAGGGNLRTDSAAGQHLDSFPGRVRSAHTVKLTPASRRFARARFGAAELLSHMRQSFVVRINVSAPAFLAEIEGNAPAGSWRRIGA